MFCKSEGQSTLHAVLGESLSPEPITPESDAQNSQKSICKNESLTQCSLSDLNESAAPFDKPAQALKGKTIKFSK